MSFTARTMLTLLLSALSACNLATSERPMFSEAERSALQLKDGYWLIDGDVDCVVDAKIAVNQWPQCADWAIVANNRIVSARSDKIDDIDPALFIAAGEPPIMQILNKATAGNPAFYYFIGIAPTARDPAGKLTAANLWAVQCGIKKPNAAGTSELVRYPGFNADCQPSSSEVVRAAADASRPIADELVRLRWMRAAN